MIKFSVVAVLFLSVLGYPAWGDAGGIPHDPHNAKHTVNIGLANEDGKTGAFDTATVGTWTEMTGEDGQLHFTYDYQNSLGYDILATDGSGAIIGTIYSLNYDAKPDPQIVLNFSCKAGSSATTFSFISAVDIVPQFTNGMARASASLTLTDNSVPANGVYANGTFDGKCYQARYNNGSVFSSLVSGFSVAGGSQTVSENDPLDGIGYRPISGTMTQMEAEYKFLLQGWDSASGTSSFVIIPSEVPEPSSILGLASALVGMAGLGLRRRK